MALGIDEAVVCALSGHFNRLVFNELKRTSSARECAAFFPRPVAWATLQMPFQGSRPWLVPLLGQPQQCRPCWSCVLPAL